MTVLAMQLAPESVTPSVPVLVTPSVPPLAPLLAPLLAPPLVSDSGPAPIPVGGTRKHAPPTETPGPCHHSPLLHTNLAAKPQQIQGSWPPLPGYQ